MEPVCSAKLPPVPENIKIVNKAHVVGITDRRGPGVETEQPAEPPHSPATGGGWARDEDIAMELFYCVKKT